jgi:hypothetical protein
VVLLPAGTLRTIPRPSSTGFVRRKADVCALVAEVMTVSKKHEHVMDRILTGMS